MHACSLISQLIACVFYSLRATRRGVNENPCYTWWMYRLIRLFVGHTGLIVCWLKLSSEQSLYLKQGIYSLLIAPGKREYSLFSFHHKTSVVMRSHSADRQWLTVSPPGTNKKYHKITILHIPCHDNTVLQFIKIIYNVLCDINFESQIPKVYMIMRAPGKMYVWNFFFLDVLKLLFNHLALIKRH